MRTGLDAPTLALYLSGSFQLHVRIKVQNGSDTMIDLYGRYQSYTLNLPKPTAPIASLEVSFVRETTAAGDATSLAPFIESSSYNKLNDGVTYSPLLQIGRLVSMEVALTAIDGARPASGWYEVFNGYITEINWPQKDSRVATISCNDYAGILEIAKSEVGYIYDAGTSLETVAQEILTNNGFTWVVLSFPVPTGKVLPNEYAPGLQKTVWSQLWSLAQSMGWVCYFRYRANLPVELTFFEPARSKVSSDMTITPYDVQALELNESEIRNVGYLVFVNGSNGQEMVGPLEDAISLAKYSGSIEIRRPFWIKLDETSPIRNSTDATDMLNAALEDVSDPDVIANMLTFPLIFSESGSDMYTFQSSDRLYDTSQLLAPFGVTISQNGHELPVSVVGVRGKPSGMYTSYLRSVFTVAPDLVPEPPVAVIDVTASTRSQETIDYQPSLGVNGIGPLSYRWRYFAVSGGTYSDTTGWSPATTVFSGTPVVLNRLAIYPYRAEMEVTDIGTGLVTRVHHDVAPVLGALDTTGLLDETTPTTQGKFPFATAVDGDTLDVIPETGTKKTVTANEKTGAARAYPAFDSSSTLLTAVAPTATIDGKNANRVARGGEAMFIEDFSSIVKWTDPTTNLPDLDGVTLVAAGVTGHYVNQIANNDIKLWNDSTLLMPFDPDVLHRITFRARVTVDVASGSPRKVYAGVVCYNAAGAFLASVFIAAEFKSLTLADGWTEFIGYVKGTSAGVGGYWAGNQTNAASPGTLPTGTVAIYPIVYVNYDSGPEGDGATTQTDLYRIDTFDERVYCALKSDGSLLPTVKQGTLIITKGRWQTQKKNGEGIVFPSGRFDVAPMYVLSGGQRNEPRSAMWSVPASFNAALPQIPVLRMDGLDAGGGDLVAILIQKTSVLTPHTKNTGILLAVDEAEEQSGALSTFSGPPSSPAYDYVYKSDIEVEVGAGYDALKPHLTYRCELTVVLESSLDGTSWTVRDSKTFIWDSSEMGMAGSETYYTTLIGSASDLTVADFLRVRITNIAGSSITVSEVRSSTHISAIADFYFTSQSGSQIWASMTPDAEDYITCEFLGVEQL